MTPRGYYGSGWSFLLVLLATTSVSDRWRLSPVLVQAFSVGSTTSNKIRAHWFSPSSADVPLLPKGAARQKTLSSPSQLFQSDSSSSEATAVSIDDVTAELQATQQELEARMAAATTVADVEALRREYMGKKGPINQVMRYMRDLAPADKPKLGAVVNQVKTALEDLIQQSKEEKQMAELQRQMELDQVDVTQPGIRPTVHVGRRHPVSMTMEKAVDIFVELGYDTVTDVDESPEIETDYYCFEALNCPKDHPARDMQDTFYLTEDLELLLRTHTSAVQIRQLEKRKPPLRIVAPGRVYRKDDIDATHSLQFHQVEILALEKRGELTLGHLKGTVEHFLQRMFGPSVKVQFRGSYFPFTEPSMEVDVFFRGKWLEVLGCGMVDPAVLEMAGIDPEEYSGFAAGFGVERFAMVMHGITDLREFTKNDARFLQQFPHFYDDGMRTFLSGAPREEPPPDLRGEEVPYPFVESMEELQQQQQQQQASAAAKAEAAPEKPKKKAAPASAAATIDISKLDIRVGVITKAWEHEQADKLFCEEIDIGGDEPRSIASGLREHYQLDDLVGQRVLVLCNLKARKLLGFPSHGMVLCAANDDAVQFVEPPANAAIGDRVAVPGFEDGEPATENQVQKKKMIEQIFPELTTNADGVACYKGVPLQVGGEPCLPTSLPNANVS